MTRDQTAEPTTPYSKFIVDYDREEEEKLVGDDGAHLSDDDAQDQDYGICLEDRLIDVATVLFTILPVVIVWRVCFWHHVVPQRAPLMPVFALTMLQVMCYSVAAVGAIWCRDIRRVAVALVCHLGIAMWAVGIRDVKIIFFFVSAHGSLWYTAYWFRYSRKEGAKKLKESSSDVDLSVV